MKTTFSAFWTEKLGQVITVHAPAFYTMSLTTPDADLVKAAVNQGIDSHLQACLTPARGDRYAWQTPIGIAGRISGPRLECVVSAESLPVLVRRLMESDDDRALSLASGICETIGIELI